MHRSVLAMAIAFLLIPTSLAQTPEGIHVGVGATLEDEEFGPPEAPWLRIQWTTRSEYTETPIVSYAIDGGAQEEIEALLHGSLRGDAASGGADDRFGYSAIVHVPRGSTIDYAVGIPGTMSQTFTAKNLPMDPRDPIRIVALGNTYYGGCDTDTGACPDNTTQVPTLGVSRQVQGLGADLILHTGGISTSGEATVPHDIVHGLMEPVFSSIPTAIAVSGTDDADGFAYFNTYWRQPGTDPGRVNLADTGGSMGAVFDTAGSLVDHVDDVSKNYFGFSAGSAYVVVLNTPRLCGTGVEIQYGVVPVNEAVEGMLNDNGPCEGPEKAYDREQLDWLHDTLEDAREDLKADWIIVAMGRGPYHFADDAQLDLYLNNHVVPLLESFNVDLVISSNEPVYQRSYPLWAGFPTSLETSAYAQGMGPVYLVTGGGGRNTPDGPLTEARVPWLAADAYEHHVTVLDISNQTLSVQALATQDGRVLDSFTISAQPEDEILQSTDKRSPAPASLLAAIGLLGIAFARRRQA